MATSSGNSIQNSGSEVDMMQDERKRKRMESNRESARRSRMRKQKHLDDLLSQVDKLKNENNHVLQTINLTSQQYLNVEAENCVLKAQMSELSQRLQSLNDMINYINTLNGPTNGVEVGCSSSLEEDNLDFLGDFGVFNNGYFGNFGTWNLGCLNNQPIMDVLQY